MNISSQLRTAIVKSSIIGFLVCAALARFGMIASAISLETKTTYYPDIGIRIEIPISWSDKVPMQKQTLGTRQFIIVTFGEQKGRDFPAWCAMSFADVAESMPLEKNRDALLGSFMGAEIISDNLVKIKRSQNGGEGVGHSIKAIGRQLVPDGAVKMVRWLFLKDFGSSGRSVYMLSCNAAEKDFEVYNVNIFEPMIESISFM